MQFFTVTEDTAPEDLKRQYRRLCIRYHPDKGGSNEIQAQINAEYQKTLEQLSEMASQNGDRESTEQLLRLMEQHLRKMYAELKTPVIQRYVPAQYQGLAFELAKLFEGKVWD